MIQYKYNEKILNSWIVIAPVVVSNLSLVNSYYRPKPHVLHAVESLKLTHVAVKQLELSLE